MASWSPFTEIKRSQLSSDGSAQRTSTRCGVQIAVDSARTTDAARLPIERFGDKTRQTASRRDSTGDCVAAAPLTGLGERSHLLTPEVDLDTHIKDISALFHYEDVHDAILVGHSYGGMVVAGVAPSVAARLAGVVYLDAFLPEDGKALQDYVPLRAPEGAWRLPPPGVPPRFGVSDPADVSGWKRGSVINRSEH